MKNIIIKTNQGEMNFDYLCVKEYKRIILIIKLIENEFNVDLNNHPELRHNILDTANFIKRLPNMVSEIGIANVGDNNEST